MTNVQNWVRRALAAVAIAILSYSPSAVTEAAPPDAARPEPSTPAGSSAPAASFAAVDPESGFAPPGIVLPYDESAKAGYHWDTLDKQPLYSLDPAAPAVQAVRYLREAIQRMTGKEVPVVSGRDLSRGIVLTTLEHAPADLKNDPEIVRALRDNGRDAYNANEAFFIRSEPRRVVIVTNTVEGFPVAVVELLESVGYEVLGMGPNWTHVPDYSNKPLVFSLRSAGRAGFYIRQFGAASGQPGGIGTLYLKPMPDPADETVERSYLRWLIGSRMATSSMPLFPGHAMQDYHRAVIDTMRQTRSTAGFLTPATVGPDAERPTATEANAWHLWINDDPEGQPGAGKVYSSSGKEWAPVTPSYVPGSLDLSVPTVRQIILEDLKRKSEAHFDAKPAGIFVFGTDPEDGSGYHGVGKRLHNRNWYPEYLAGEGVEFGRPYVLHGFQGLDQPREFWDPEAASDTVFGFNNWLLREYDKWIDSRPAAERLTRAGRPKKELVRASLYSYNYHDVPPNFNLDPRIRAMIAGYPKHRGMGKWKQYATPLDIARAFQKQLPSEPSGDYWILSLAAYYDQTTDALNNSSNLPATLRRQLLDQYDAGFRAISAEMDFNFGRLGLEYYLYGKLLWNPHQSEAEIDAIRDRWLQRAYGSVWREMKAYYDFVAPENYPLNAPNSWAKAIRLIEAADAKLDGAAEPIVQRRIDDLKQFWYFYYLLDSGQAKSDSPAMREFFWKGQMSYMTAMHAVASNIFKTSDVRAAVGPELSAGRAHYTHEETQAWWAKVLAHWQVTPVDEFPDATLADGRKGRDVDLNDLVSVATFRGEKPADAYFYYQCYYMKATVLTVATRPGEEIGFKLSWGYNPAISRSGAIDVPYGISRWDPTKKAWEALVDITMTRKPSVLTRGKLSGMEGVEAQLVEVRFSAPVAGTYRIDIGEGGEGAKLTSLAYDLTTDTFTGAPPFTYPTLAEGYTQSPAYFYIPKGTKSLDFEVWGPAGAKTLQLHSGLPAKGLTPTRKVDVSRRGTHRVPLNEGEDGSIAMFYGDLFHMPRLYSVPQLWAKSPDALLVPRVIAEVDRLETAAGP